MNTTYFNAPLSVGVRAAQDGRRFAGILYRGGLITDHPTWEAVAFEPQTMKVATPTPLLYQRRHEQTGGVEGMAIGTDVRISGVLRTVFNDDAKRVTALPEAMNLATHRHEGEAS